VKRRDEVRDPIRETWDSLSAAQRDFLTGKAVGPRVQRKTVLVLWDYGLIDGARQLTPHGVKVRDYGTGVTA
jgi:hypothetical protein